MDANSEPLDDLADGAEGEGMDAKGTKAPSDPIEAALEGVGIGARITNPRLMASEARVLRRAIRGGWVDDETGLAAVAGMRDAMRQAVSLRDRTAAARVIASLAMVDVARERSNVLEHKADLSATLAAIRLAQSTPEGRAALAALSQEVCTPTPSVDPPAPLPPPPDNVR